MDQVYEGEEVTCTAQVSAPIQAEVRWRQEPSSPSGRFSPLSGAVVRWHAPLVERATSFSIVAYIVVQGRTYEGSSSVVVLDRSEPPQEPPRISIDWPEGETVVGAGVLLTIIGTVSQGSNALKELVVLDSDGSLLQRWPVTSGAFRVDLSSFGSPGRKVIRVRVVDSQGLFGETQLPIINDNNQLDSAARDFLRRYNVAPDGGSLRFAVTDIPVLVPNSLKQYWELFEEACEFWNKYCPILHLYPTTSNSSEYVIRVFDETSQNSQYVAVTNRTYNGHEIVSASIDLYEGWLEKADEMKKTIVAHEIGHGILKMSHVDEFGPLFIMSSAGDAGGSERVIPPIVQHAIKLLYTHQPGWQP
jgi:hypothetical protein